MDQGLYTLSKNFVVYYAPTSQQFSRKDYSVIGSRLHVCEQLLGKVSLKLTSDDLLICNDSIIDVKHQDYFVNPRNNFAIYFKKKEYNYKDYGVTTNGVKICNSTDRDVQSSWRLRNGWLSYARLNCNGRVLSVPSDGTFTIMSLSDLSIYNLRSNQLFSTDEYGILKKSLIFCEESFMPDSLQLTNEDLLLCNNNIINVTFKENYQIQNDDFSMMYKKRMYKNLRYTVDDGGIKICNISDIHRLYAWRSRYEFVQRKKLFEKCNGPLTRLLWKPLENLGHVKVLKDFTIIMPSGQVIPKEDNVITHYNSIFFCLHYPYSKVRLMYIAVMASLSFSLICSLLLLIVYSMLPNLRTLPGLNIMSLSLAFSLWDIRQLNLHSRFLYTYPKEIEDPCLPWVIPWRITFFSVLTNAVVNVYHLRKSFSSDPRAKSDEKKVHSFLRYIAFSWGFPVIIATAEFAVTKKNLLNFYFHNFLGNNPCFYYARNSFSYAWYISIELVLPWSLVFYIVVVFLITGYQIRRKLKASRNIAETSKVVRNRKNFVILLKLITTTALTCIPLMLLVDHINMDYYVIIVLYPATLLTGVYMAIAFVFTRKNYQMLMKKFFAK
jgi:hypothetical protein